MPHFAKAALERSLPVRRIAYLHVPGLGGLRKATHDSINLGWRNVSFRGYADYMQTEEFWESLDNLIALADNQQVAIMCAEAVPWRCHRSLIADALVTRGVDVRHITGKGAPAPHALTEFAEVVGDGRVARLIYPRQTLTLPL